MDRRPAIQWLWPVLKVAFAVALVGIMVKRQLLDFTWLRNLHEHPGAPLVLAAVIYGQVFLSSIRWRWLLRAQGADISVASAIRLTLTGCAFSTIIPGTVSGDVVKLYYLRSFNIDSGLGIASLAADRIAGLLGLILLGAGPAVFLLSTDPGETFLTTLSRALIATGAAIVIGTAVLLRFGRRVQELLDRTRFPFSTIVGRIFASLGQYRLHLGSLAVALGISIFIHALTCAAVLWAGSMILGKNLPVVSSVLVVPLVLVAMAVPITPAGIGVGQAAAFALFELAHSNSGKDAASAFTIFQTMLILVYATGLIPYVLYRNSVRRAEADVMNFSAHGQPRQ